MESNRRSFLKVAGVGVGVAWAAPQIISTPAAAAQSLLAPPFKSWAGAHDVNGDDLTITIGTGTDQLDVSTGDFLIALAANHIDNSHLYGSTTPAGWTLLGTVDAIDAGGQNPGVRTRVFTYPYAGEASFTFALETTPPVASTAWSLVIAAYAGALSLDPASPATNNVASGIGSITVGGITPSIPQVTTVVLIGAENPVNPWSAPGAYTQHIDYTPNNSVPEIYLADASLNTTSVGSATFTETNLGHPYTAWMLGVAPV